MMGHLSKPPLPRRLSSAAFLFSAIGRIPFDRVSSAVDHRRRQDAHRVLFKRSWEQRIDVHEE